jgi:hypothetical protein
VFLEDAGKEGNSPVAQDRSGKKLLDRALPNDEAKLPSPTAG